MIEYLLKTTYKRKPGKIPSIIDFSKARNSKTAFLDGKTG